LSTAKAEYVAASSCAQDLVWLRGVLSDLKCQQTDPTGNFEDNTAAIKWSFSGSHVIARRYALRLCIRLQLNLEQSYVGRWFLPETQSECIVAGDQELTKLRDELN
jgi:hypothetical protein